MTPLKHWPVPLEAPPDDGSGGGDLEGSVGDEVEKAIALPKEASFSPLVEIGEGSFPEGLKVLKLQEEDFILPFYFHNAFSANGVIPTGFIDGVETCLPPDLPSYQKYRYFEVPFGEILQALQSSNSQFRVSKLALADDFSNATTEGVWLDLKELVRDQGGDPKDFVIIYPYMTGSSPEQSSRVVLRVEGMQGLSFETGRPISEVLFSSEENSYKREALMATEVLQPGSTHLYRERILKKVKSRDLPPGEIRNFSLVHRACSPTIYLLKIPSE